MSNKISFDQVIEVGCAADVHKNNIVATIRWGSDKYETKEFGCYTSSLTKLRAWCQKHGVTHFAMESTGVYWKPVYNILAEEGQLEIILVNARHVKNVPGHKTDKKDSIWLSKLLLSGLLKGSFIPPTPIRELRDLVRYKKKIVEQRSSEKNRIIRILEDANVKLSSVLSDVHGAVGQKIIQDILNGITDAKRLSRHYHGKMHKSRKEFRLALEGRIRAHHRFMLKTLKMSIDQKDELINTIEAQIDEQIKAYQEDVDNLQTIDGVGRDSAITIISEIGNDMSQFPSEKHLSSWSGMSPGNHESGGKKKRQDNKRQ